MSKLSYKTLFTIFFFLLIGVIVLSKFVLPNQKVSAAWWNDMWMYRKAISISNTSGSNLTDFQVSLSVGTSALIASGKMQSDCDDIRVTDINGNLLAYWIETGTCNTDTTKILSQINSLPTSGSTIYIYYGNPSANSTQNASAVPRTCSNVNSYLGTGLYYINPNGLNNSTPVQAYCDMTTDGGGWTLVASWNTAQEWTKTSNSTASVFSTTALNAVSSNFGNAIINDFRVLASDTVTAIGTSSYADWYYHYNTATTWKEVWAPSSNLGGNMTDGYRSTSPRQALKPFNYSYNVKFNYQVVQTWNNLSDWGIGTAQIGCLPNYWNALTAPGNPFGFYSIVYYTGSNGTGCGSPVSDGSLGICPSDQANCNTGQDRNTNNSKIGYDDGAACAGFGSIGTTSVGEQPGIQATTKLWWFIRNGTPTSTSYSISSPSSEEISIAPIAYWKFDEGVGTTVYDSTSNRKNGTILGATWQTEDLCISGKCLLFNGSTNYIDTNYSYNMSYNSSTTFSFWFKPASNSTGGYLKDIIAKNSAEFLIGQIDQKISFQQWNSAGTNLISLNSTNFIQVNRWYYITIIADSSDHKAKLFINGKADNTSNITNDVFLNATESVKIGKGYGWGGSTTPFFNGFIDDVKIYSYARTAAQIKLDYNTGKSHASSIEGTSASLGSNTKNSEAFSDGLVAYWKMDENTGSNITDSSGNSNTGTFGTGSSAPSWSIGKYGVGLSFNGTNNYIYSPDTNNIFDTNYMTITGWIYKPSDDSGHHTVVGRNGESFLINFYGSNFESYFYTSGGTCTNSGTSFTNYLNGWHFFAASYDGQNSNLYIDNNLIKTVSTCTGTINSSTSNVYVGSRTSSSAFLNAKLDEVRIYNRALNPSEISQLYNYAPGPIIHWKFDENNGTSASDSSSKNNTGIFGTGNSAPSWTTGKYGSALSFDGQKQYLSANIPDITTNQPFTIMAWAKSTGANSNMERILADYATTYLNWNTNNTISFMRQNGSYVSTTSTNVFAINQWHHVVGVYDGTNITLYVNGIFQNTSNIGAGVRPFSQISAGRDYSDWTDFFHGSIDDVRVYNYARTQKQIIEDMNAGASATSTKSMLAYWRFDEGNGTITKNSAGSNYNLTSSGQITPIWQNIGKNNKSIYFYGTDAWSRSYFSTTPINVGTSGVLTFSFWINPDATQTVNSNGMFVRNGIGGDQNYAFQIGNPSAGKYKLTISRYNGSWETLTTTNYLITASQWNHVTIILNESVNWKVYVNGQYIETITITGTAANSTSTFNIGGHGGTSNQYFNGSIDEFKIYNYALTPDEIKLDYNQGSAIQMGASNQTIGATTTSLEYCIPGDTTYCASPVAEWNFEENTGTSAKDTSGNNNNGTFGTGNSAPTWSIGKIGAGLNFDGSNDYLTAGTGPSLNISNAVTVESWVNLNSWPSNWNNIVGKGSGWTTSNYNILIQNNGTLRITFQGLSNDYISTSSLTTKKWYYLATTYDGSNIKLYLDGLFVGSTQATGTMTTNSSNLNIGRQEGYSGSYVNGKIDQVKIYNYARTPAQIAYDYNKGGPVGWWQLDECQGNIAQDWSGVGNTGTIIIGASGTQNSLGTCQVGTSAAWTNGAIGKINSSLNLDGVDDSVLLSSTLPITTGDFTISLWTKINSSQPAGATWHALVSNKNAAAASAGFGMVWNSGQNKFLWSTANGSSASEILTQHTWESVLDKWAHIVMVRKSGAANNGNFYINGVYEPLSSSGTVLNVETSNLMRFGNTSSPYASYYFGGQLDDVRIYNYALTSEQVKILYNGGVVNFN